MSPGRFQTDQIFTMAVVSIVSLVLTLSKPLMMPLKCTELSRTKPSFLLLRA